MIYFIGERFLNNFEEHSIIDYVQSEITIDAEYINEKDLENLKSVKNNIFIIDSELNISNIIEPFKSKNYIINICLEGKSVQEASIQIVNIIQNKKISDYEILSKVYDQMQDRIDYNMYDQIFKKYLKPNTTFLEIGSGTGNVTKKLIDFKQDVVASDISKPLLKKLSMKYPQIKTKYINATNINIKEKFDYCGMFLDTINYIDGKEVSNVFKGIYEILNENGLFIFDMHMISKIDEYDGYIEEIEFDDFFFNWLSYKESENEVIHRFMFINNEIKIEEHKQYIYPLDFYEQMYKNYFSLEYKVEIDNRLILVLKKK